MKLRHPWLLRVAGFAAGVSIRLWMNTVRFRVHTYLPGAHPADPRQQRYIYAFWHESILAMSAFGTTKANVLISQHADGEFIAQACKPLRVGVVRGSTTRGGVGALLQMWEKSGAAHLAITPDGPKGPRRRVQIGMIWLASQAQLPIILCGAGFGQAWRARSWDRFAVPYPYSAIHGVLSEPIIVPPGLTRPELEQARAYVENRFLEVTAEAERWAETGERPAPAQMEQSLSDRRAA